MKLAALFLVSSVAFAACGNGYLHCESWTVNASQVPSTQTNFTVPSYGTFTELKTTGNGGQVSNASGFDIIWTSDAACGTLLPFERVTWSATTGAAEFWILVSSLSNGSVIWRCWGNSAIITDQQTTGGGAWDSNYIGIWHLPNGSTLTANDSSSLGNNGTLQNTPTATTGQFDGAGQFVHASNQYISIAYNPNFTSMTFESWAQTSSRPSVEWMTLNTTSSGSSDGCWLEELSSGFANFLCQGGGFRQIAGSTNLADGNWHQLVGSATSSGLMTLYVDGTSVNSSASGAGLVQNPGQVLIANYWNTGNGLSFGGNIDEVRLSKVIRGADWIKTEFNAQNQAAFWTVGTPITAGGIRHRVQ